MVGRIEERSGKRDLTFNHYIRGRKNPWFESDTRRGVAFDIDFMFGYMDYENGKVIKGSYKPYALIEQKHKNILFGKQIIKSYQLEGLSALSELSGVPVYLLLYNNIHGTVKIERMFSISENKLKELDISDIGGEHIMDYIYGRNIGKKSWKFLEW